MPAPRKTQDAPAAPGGLRAAIAIVWAMPPQRAVMSLAFLVNIATYPFILGLLPYVAREVYLTDQTGLGYMVAVAAGGCVAASILLGRLEGRLMPARSMIAFCLVWQLLTGIAQGLCMVPMTVIQLRNAPPELRGRIAGLRTLAVYGLPLGLWLSGPLIEYAGFAAAALTYGGIGFACTLVMLIVWRRHLWSADAPANR
jgi:hypothetical protein